jgi:hypothetical protein
MSNLSFRELERVTGETTPAGDETRTEKVYEYGAEVEGVFVRIGTFTSGQVADARVRHDAEQARRPQSEQAQSEQAQQSSTSGDTAPDEQSTVSESRATDATG